MITLCDNGEFTLTYPLLKAKITKEGYQKIIALPETKAKQIVQAEKEYVMMQEELYDTFYNDEL